MPTPKLGPPKTTPPARFKTEFKPLIQKLEKHRDAIGKERDQLRNLMEEIAGLISSTEEGLVALEDTIDRLSEMA